MTPDIWEKLAEEIFNKYDHYDGFVVTHGTDTMSYTASALSFALKNLGKPVVFTGSQIPGNKLGSDARRNLVNAMRVATTDISGVFVLFDEKIILGVRSSKTSHNRLEAFRSINVPSCGHVNVNLSLDPHLPKRHHGKIMLQNEFDPKIAVISLVPGLPVEFLFELLRSPVHAIVFEAYGSGNIAKEYFPFLDKAYHQKMPVVIRTQCLEGATEMKRYEMGLLALKLHVIEAFDMTLETTITKLMWTLKQTKDCIEIKKIMHTNFIGEITVT